MADKEQELQNKIDELEAEKSEMQGVLENAHEGLKKAKDDLDRAHDDLEKANPLDPDEAAKGMMLLEQTVDGATRRFTVPHTTSRAKVYAAKEKKKTARFSLKIIDKQGRPIAE